MTIEIKKKLEAEIRQIQYELKNELPQELKKAVALGDLSENAEYQYAKEEQGFIEGRIHDLEGKLSNAQIIDVTKIPCAGKVIFGVTVMLMNRDNDEEITYQIVGDEESDIKLNKLSIYSPIARALIGKKEGDEVSVEPPGGQVEYEILEVQHI